MHLQSLRPLILVSVAAAALVLTAAPATASGSCGNDGPYLHHNRPQHGYQIHGGYRSQHARYVRYQPRQHHGHHGNSGHGYRSHGYYPSQGYRRGTTLGFGHGHRHGSRYGH